MTYNKLSKTTETVSESSLTTKVFSRPQLIFFFLWTNFNSTKDYFCYFLSFWIHGHTFVTTIDLFNKHTHLFFILLFFRIRTFVSFWYKNTWTTEFLTNIVITIFLVSIQIIFLTLTLLYFIFLQQFTILTFYFNIVSIYKSYWYVHEFLLTVKIFLIIYSVLNSSVTMVTIYFLHSFKKLSQKETLTYFRFWFKNNKNVFTISILNTLFGYFLSMS